MLVFNQYTINDHMQRLDQVHTILEHYYNKSLDLCDEDVLIFKKEELELSYEISNYLLKNDL